MMRSISTPRRSRQTESFERPKRPMGLAKGTPLSERMASGRPRSRNSRSKAVTARSSLGDSRASHRSRKREAESLFHTLLIHIRRLPRVGSSCYRRASETTLPSHRSAQPHFFHWRGESHSAAHLGAPFGAKQFWAGNFLDRCAIFSKFDDAQIGGHGISQAQIERRSSSGASQPLEKALFCKNK